METVSRVPEYTQVFAKVVRADGRVAYDGPVSDSRIRWRWWLSPARWRFELTIRKENRALARGSK